MATYAVVRESDLIVENLILWDGSTPYNPGAGRQLVASTIAHIEDKYENGKFWYWDAELQQWVERI